MSKISIKNNSIEVQLERYLEVYLQNLAYLLSEFVFFISE